MEAFNYQFTALRGIQAGREFYVVMCPLKLIPKIFLFDEEEIPPELRAQRVLNRARVPEIARYILDNPSEYVFSSITASIDGEVSFTPNAERGHARNVGSLVVPMTARFLINDGQHRRAAIEEALKENPQLGDETVSVVFFIDAGLERSQQLFADLNTHAVRPSKSLGILYDKRDPFARLALSLGGRKTESASRAQVLNSHHGKVTGSRLRRHHILTRAYVYTPIEDFTTDDVWTYLLQVPSPWGSNNRDLAALYRSAQSGECPLVVDDTTPSCGNSRFGCWTCTVVTRDRSMEAMIDSGQEWMLPLLEFRDWLAETQDPARKHLYREHKRRTGQVSIKDGKLIRGPYKLEFCKEILRRLLDTQNRVRAEGPDPNQELISAAELHEIRRIWRTERQDWDDSVPQIYAEMTGRALDWLQDDIGAFSALEYRVLHETCQEHDLPTDLVARLLEQERQLQGMHRRSGIFQRIDEVLREEWRDEATIRQVYNLPLPADVEEAAQ